MPDNPNAQTERLVTPETALAHAARLLSAAELETNLALMERLEKLADSWVDIARLLRN